MSTWQHHRARLAALRRHHGPGADTAEVERDLRAARAEQYVRQLVADEPPLTAEQRVRLVRLLTGAGDAT
jgi:aromatic ring hydroxylase